MSKQHRFRRRDAWKKWSFAEMLALDPELAAVRREYAAESAVNRRAAAEWAYDSEQGIQS